MCRFCLFMIALSLTCSTVAFGQQDLSIKVKKPCPVTREFSFQGKPVSPEALIPLFPSMADGTSPDSSSLQMYPYRSQAIRDTTGYCLCKQGYMGWLSRKRGTDDYEQVIDSTQEFIMSAYVSYCVRQMTTGNKFIVETAYNSGGTLTEQCIMVLDIRGDYLVKLASLCKDYDTKYNTFEIKGNIIELGPKRLIIPASAR